MADSFTHERALGTPDLFSTLATDQIQARTSNGNPDTGAFAYQQTLGTPDLFPTLISDTTDNAVRAGSMANDVPVWRDIWAHEADLNG